MYAYSNLVSEGINVNELDRLQKREQQQVVNNNVMHVIDDVPSVVEYSMALADNENDGPPVSEPSDDHAAVQLEKEYPSSEPAKKKEWYQNNGAKMLDTSKLSKQE